MLSVLKTDNDLRRLEKSGRLLRRGFIVGLHQVAAADVGEKLRLMRPEDAADQFDSIDAVWAHIDAALDARLQGYEVVGGAPFWFVDCEDWPASAFLAAPGFMDWARAQVASDRPLMAACFSAEQLLIGYADSAEFHDRLGHVREAPMERPLGPIPFLLSEDGLVPVDKIELHLGDQVRLLPMDGDAIELSLA